MSILELDNSCISSVTVQNRCHIRPIPSCDLTFQNLDTVQWILSIRWTFYLKVRDYWKWAGYVIKWYKLLPWSFILDTNGLFCSLKWDIYADLSFLNPSDFYVLEGKHVIDTCTSRENAGTRVHDWCEINMSNYQIILIKNVDYKLINISFTRILPSSFLLFLNAPMPRLLRPFGVRHGPRNVRKSPRQTRKTLEVDFCPPQNRIVRFVSCEHVTCPSRTSAKSTAG